MNGRYLISWGFSNEAIRKLQQEKNRKQLTKTVYGPRMNRWK